MDLSDKDSNRQHFAMKTDLNLLLECLKYQMDSPASQKQALVTICSICQQNGDISDYFREIGGLLFVYNLAQSNQHSEVKETALFTLGALAESSENGQSLVKTTGCIDILLDLLRTSFPFSDENGTNENITQGYQLWSSVSSALCACVNNPQNEENQRICTAAFPFLKEWLQKCVRKEITQPIYSFVGLTVANNPYSQGFFAAVCGLDTLAQVFVKLVDESSRNPLSGELAVVVTKTLCACIADNVPLAAGLSKYHIVPKLLTLLSCSWLDSGGRLCIILTIGHCTEACEAHQFQLLENGGLPQMIQFLSQSPDEELNKAATFVLQSCKQITEKLSLGLNDHSRDKRNTPTMQGTSHTNLESYRRSAKEMMKKIDLIEKQHTEEMYTSVEEEPNNTRESFQADAHGRANSFLNKRLTQLMEGIRKDFSKSSCGESSEELPVRKVKGGGAKRDLLFQDDRTRIENAEHTPNQAILGDKGTILGSRRETDEQADRTRNNVLADRVRRQIFSVNNELQCTIEQHAVPVQQQQVKIAHTEGVNERTWTRQEEQEEEIASDEPHVGAACPREPAGQQGTTHTTSKSSMNPSSSLPAAGRTSSLSSERAKRKRENDGELSLPDTVAERLFVFKCPAPVNMNKKKQDHLAASIRDDMAVCSEILDHEINNILNTPASSVIQKAFRCSGCVTGVSPVNSRNFSHILRSCPYKCDRHTVLLETEDRYKMEVKKSLNNKRNSLAFNKSKNLDIRLTPVRKGSSFKNSTSRTYDSYQRAERFILTPRKKPQISTLEVPSQNGISLPLKPTEATYKSSGACHRTDHRERSNVDNYQEREEAEERDVFSFKDAEDSPYGVETQNQKPKRRERKNFSREEVEYLLDGVKKLGTRWNSILWSYPFQTGRTNVDLAKKYKKLAGASQFFKK
ncbi:telomere repeats-binding bouquet formation protein 1-like isoform X3 [Acipenser ruthenus]|uniref:telomere repeats-binding bouquet formation protein 1-like isoform X3 n=1 Tax=Acipenser ruthenus TaxID=7906 RepID=UPI002740F7C3|nr:telomere repeats-binding bouquet formation protein 1-like isoform X3 [Acipenser ruthenus]